MHPTKELLIKRNGMYCMLCGQKCEYNELEWHHIKWKSVSLRRGEKVDNSYENGAILCVACHHYVHTFSYWSKEYDIMMGVVRSHKR